jgi:hypothetical protein
LIFILIYDIIFLEKRKAVLGCAKKILEKEEKFFTKLKYGFIN